MVIQLHVTIDDLLGRKLQPVGPSLTSRRRCHWPLPATGHARSSPAGGPPLPALARRQQMVGRRQAVVAAAAAGGQPAAVAAAASVAAAAAEQPAAAPRWGLAGALVQSVQTQFLKLDGLWDK